MGFTTKLKAMFGAQDMTVGKPMDCLIKFSVPLLIGNILQLLYNTVDSLIVSNMLGTNAFSAVGVAGSVMNLFIFVLNGFCTGISVIFFASSITDS